ncbi:anthranilate synthase component II [Candidatus Vidania fulgoroideorum]
MIIIIDNLDSSIFNIKKIFLDLGYKNIKIYKNYEINIKYILKNINNIKLIVFSPGPKNIFKFNKIIKLYFKVYNKVPILGICLGHQLIAYFYKGKFSHQNIKHGEVVNIKLNNFYLFKNLPKTIKVVRYNSINISSNISKEIKIISYDNNNQIMAIHHKKLPILGIQFHPESIFTGYGKKIIQNFLKKCKKN